MIKRGEVYWAAFDPAVGGEIRKTRPTVVVSNDVNNVHSPTVTILPLSLAVQRVYPFEVFLAAETCGNKNDCKVKVDQIRAVDKRRLGDLVGQVPDFLMDDIAKALRCHLSL
ncbi:MAG: type II toxin-antitoxin system PemK/MazF family toxin [Elusimicrobiota bacterium]